MNKLRRLLRRLWWWITRTGPEGMGDSKFGVKNLPLLPSADRLLRIGSAKERAKRKAQEKLMAEYAARKDEFPSLSAFLNAPVDDPEWIRAFRAKARGT